MLRTRSQAPDRALQLTKVAPRRVRFEAYEGVVAASVVAQIEQLANGMRGLRAGARHPDRPGLASGADVA